MPVATHVRRVSKFISFWFCLLGLSACNTSDRTQGSMAERSLAARAGFITEVGQPKDFVVRSRPKADYAYPEVTPTPAERSLARRSPDDIKALEGRLDASRNRSASLARRPVPKSSYGGVAEARRAALGARTRANRPIYTPNSPQPTSYPVPESRRTGKLKKMSNPLAIPKE